LEIVMDRIEPDMFRPIGTITADIVRGLRNEIAYSGGTITQPGIYRGVPMDAYHGKPDLFDGFSMSSSGLRAVLRRPSEYWATSPFNPERETQESTKALDFGRAAHAILLGDEDFARHYVIRPDEIEGKPWQGNRTICQLWLEGQRNKGMTIVTPDDLAKIERIAKSLRGHPLVADGLLSGRAERTLCTKVDGLWLKARPDVIPRADGVYVDLKTAADVSDEGIERAIYSSGYHVQAALIRKVVTALGGQFDTFVFVFVEKASPFDVRIMELKSETLDIGTRQLEQAIKTVRRCIAESRWPGFDGFDRTESYCELPGWAASRIKQNLEADERAAA
jgi:hypothetical protein